MISRSVLIFSLFFSAAYGDGVCRYFDHREGYSCELKTKVTFDSSESSNFVITGTHSSGKTDDDVVFILPKDSLMDFIPPSIFLKFKNLAVVDFSNVELKSITAETFKYAKNVKNFWLQNNKLPFLPGNVFANTKAEFINLRVNEIQSVSWNAFANIPNVSKIQLELNKLLWTLDPRIFQNLANLKELQLWSNQLTDIPADAFQNLQKLEILSLAQNRLIKLETDTFKPLTSLKTLHLDENGIKNIEKGFFNVLQKLTSFKFTKNVCGDFEVNGIKNVNLEIVPRLENCYDGQLKCHTSCKTINEL